MPLAIIIVVAIIICGAFYARANRGTRNCRWRKDKASNRGELRKYHCVTCGAEAFTATKGAPTQCKRKFAKTSL